MKNLRNELNSRPNHSWMRHRLGMEGSRKEVLVLSRIAAQNLE